MWCFKQAAGLSVFLLVLAPLVAQAQSSFDWRYYPGSAGLAAAGIAPPAGVNINLPAGNYMTPVRDQGQVGSCWAFSAIGVLEAKYDIVTGTVNSKLDLSEQNLICAGSQTNAPWAWFGSVESGGWPDMCLAYVANYGVVTEAKMPYISTNGGSDISPYWPLQGSYTLYRATDILDSCGLLNNLGVDPTNFTANSNSTTTFTASLKTALETDGPLGAAIDSETDWYNLPGTPNTPISSLGGYNGIDHAVVITGFTDDPSAPGGGYWDIKNSWGADWNGDGLSDGYGFVSYYTMQLDDYVYGIGGTVYTVDVPEPSTLALLAVGAISLVAYAWRRRGAKA